ncbi:cytochrome c oxidase subunit 2A [Alkalihalobacillus sp. BA299]|uniref:cytochrome c oxidase subunit 2A n=1 Tax=Alkalihalobacillus sp. BA299 TaxID=2815938 RepID=UPI001ADBE348|nr:cytochrome c oxidase subunit 2A [Alkalihalobacillus sp. BA299]
MSVSLKKRGRGKVKKHEKAHSHFNLKGTLISVLILLSFIIVSWIGVFFLFLSR